MPCEDIAVEDELPQARAGKNSLAESTVNFTAVLHVAFEKLEWKTEA